MQRAELHHCWTNASSSLLSLWLDKQTKILSQAEELTICLHREERKLKNLRKPKGFDSLVSILCFLRLCSVLALFVLLITRFSPGN